MLILGKNLSCSLEANSKKSREELINYVKKKTTEQLFEEVLDGQVQKYLNPLLKKVYPLSTCEIRVLKVEKFLDSKPAKKETTAKE